MTGLEAAGVALWGLQTGVTGWAVWAWNRAPVSALRWWQRGLQALAVKYLPPGAEPDAVILVRTAVPEAVVAKGTRVILLQPDRVTPVADYRVLGRRPWRITHEGTAFDCIEERDGTFLYAAAR